MVAGIHLVIHPTVVGLKMIRTHNVVYAEIETFLIERQPQTHASLNKTVCQRLADYTTGIGNGSIVEITA